MFQLPILNRSHTAEELEQFARDCKDERWARRARAIAMVLRGVSRTEVGRAQGVGVQTVRDWVILYNRGGVDGLRPLPRGGSRCRLSEEQQETVRKWVEAGPQPEDEAPSRFRLSDIVKRIKAVFGIQYSLEGVRQLLLRLGFRHVSPRPLHPKAELAAQDDFRNNFRELAEEAAGDATGPIEIWVQDESRVGQQGMLSRVWARKGTRPRIPRDRRFGYCYLFSAACPARELAVGHISERANTTEMNRHLEDIGEQVAPGSHAVVVLDGAGWHKSKELAIPNNISLLFLPPYSPELNPMENVFEFLKSSQLANRVFQTVEDVRIAVRRAWMEFVEDPERIHSITYREWANLKAAPGSSQVN